MSKGKGDKIFRNAEGRMRAGEQICSMFFDRRTKAKREQDRANKDFETLNMETVVKTLERLGYNPTEELVRAMPNLNEQQKAKVNQSLAEMGQRELVAERKEIKHEGLSLLEVLEAQARAQASDEDDD